MARRYYRNRRGQNDERDLAPRREPTTDSADTEAADAVRTRAAEPGPVLRKSACACGGTCPKCREENEMLMKSAQAPQTGRLEREADRVAESALRPTSAGDGPIPIQERVPDLSAGPLHRKGEAGSAAGEGASTLPPDTGGHPLPEGERRFFESRLGRGFDDVRVHSGTDAGESARSLGALAYTVGKDIVFAPGQYAPGTAGGRQLLGHELTHVAQQGLDGKAVQKQDDGTGKSGAGPTTAPAPAGPPAAPVLQGPEALDFLVLNPRLEPDPGLQAAILALDRYSAQVPLMKVEFRVFTGERQSHLGSMPVEGGRSHWEGAMPVIELPEETYQTVTDHLANGGLIHETHEVIRTVGHELFHLERQKTGNAGNPILPKYQADYARRIAEVRKNWVEYVKRGGPERLEEVGVPKTGKVEKWEDIPAANQKKIEEEVWPFPGFEGFYQRTAYLVEENYAKMEELHFLRIEQAFASQGADPKATEARASMSELAGLFLKLRVALEQSVHSDPEIMTPQLVEEAKAAMLATLRKRFPHRSDTSYDSLEVLFWQYAAQTGRVPHIVDGRLVSPVPPGARNPPAPEETGP